MTNQKTKRYFGELVRLPDGSFKALKMKELVRVNQHKQTWRPLKDSRELMRELNRSKLVIN